MAAKLFNSLDTNSKKSWKSYGSREDLDKNTRIFV